MFAYVTGIYKPCPIIEHIAKNPLFDKLLKLSIFLLGNLMCIFNAWTEL